MSLQQNPCSVYYRFFILLVSLLPVFMISCGDPETASLPPDGSEAYRVLGSIRTWGDPYDIAFHGNTAYVAENEAGVGVYDFSIPSAPSVVDTFFLADPLPTRGVEIVPEMNAMILNVKRPIGGVVLLRWLDSLETQVITTYQWGSSIENDLHAFMRQDTVLSRWDHTYHYVDMMQLLIADPTTDDAIQKRVFYLDSLIEDGQFQRRWMILNDINSDGFTFNSSPPEGIALMDSPDTIAVAMADLGVCAGSVHRRHSPGVWLGHVDTPGEAMKLRYQAPYIFVADGNAGLAVIDAGNIEQLELVASWDYDGSDHVDQLDLDDYRLMLVDQYDGVFFLDVSDPLHPRYVGTYEVRGCRMAKFFGDNLAVLLIENVGLVVLEIDY